MHLRRVRVPEPAPPAPIPWANPQVAKLMVDPPPTQRVPWLSFVLVFAAAAALTFIAIYLNALRTGSGLVAPQFLRAWLPNNDLGLRVEPQAERLFVHWDRRSPLVRYALKGQLQIEDGAERRTLSLDAVQVAAGSILYTPASGDVTFRLEVESDQGARGVESVRVLDASKPPPANIEAPKPESNGSPPALVDQR